MIHNLGKDQTILNQFIAELRDEQIQKDAMRFRFNMQRIGRIMAYEISKTLKYHNKEVITPLGSAQVTVPIEQPVIGTILRAGLPLHQGLLDIFDASENAFVMAYRKYHKNGNFDIQIEYMTCPSIENKILILSDPMLATGQSMVHTYKELIERNGKPSHTHLMSVVASCEGIEYVKKHLPSEDYTLWVGSIDEELTAQSFIVPGIGDAGDLAFGRKN